MFMLIFVHYFKKFGGSKLEAYNFALKMCQKKCSLLVDGIMLFFFPYSEEGEVTTAVNACDLEVAHYNFTALIVFPQSAILLLQVRQRAQLVLRSSTYYEKRNRRREISQL